MLLECSSVPSPCEPLPMSSYDRVADRQLLARDEVPQGTLQNHRQGVLRTSSLCSDSGRPVCVYIVAIVVNVAALLNQRDLLNWRFYDS